MTLSVWRYAHLALAIISFLFLTMASITGVILAIDPVVEKTQPYKVDNFDAITLAQSLPELRKIYPELVELSVNHNQFVTLEGFDADGNDFKQFVNPITGKALGTPKEKSEFIQ
ncbi:MAG: FAD-binding oxidoreductase, partial [Algoriella sp.]